ncbi:hypothetical protein KF840_23010 [bacterium]|nr:hypothetical protein [bacterium]
MGAIDEGISAIRATIAAVKKVSRRFANSRGVDRAVVELQSAINDAREMAEDLRSETIALLARIRELEERADFRARMVHDDRGILLKDPPQGYAEGPYCSACWEVRRNLVLLTDLGSRNYAGPWACPECHQDVAKPR